MDAQRSRRRNLSRSLRLTHNRLHTLEQNALAGPAWESDRRRGLDRQVDPGAVVMAEGDGCGVRDVVRLEDFREAEFPLDGLLDLRLVRRPAPCQQLFDLCWRVVDHAEP